MALGYPQHQPLQYNPFRKTSFGFGVGALQNLPNNPFPNATDYAKVIITVDDATHWDDSGHIQTAEVGTAVSTYSSETFTWEVEGERNDVETILADLVFYPPAYQPLTDWRPTALKENDATGSYTDEEPADTVAVPDTFMEITVYNSSGWVTKYDIYVDAVDPVYNNPRPYFSSYNTQIIDLANGAGPGVISQTGFDDPEGQLLPLDLIVDHSDDEEILEVRAEFLRVSDGTQYTGTAYGVFTDYQDYYVGGKKGIVQNTTDKRFNFVGKKAECNAFLENLEYTSYPNGTGLPAESSFIIRSIVSDGQVGSYVDTLLWHSDTTISWYGDPSGQSFTEDTTANWDFGTIVLQNLDLMAEVDVFSAFITLSRSGAENFYTTTTVDSQSFANDVLTITDTDYNVILTALRNLVFVPKQDFSSNFSFGLDFIFESTVYGTTYSTSNFGSTGYIVNATATEELSFKNTTHTFVEDFRYDLSTGDVPQIVHPFNETFQIDFIPNQSGIGWIKTFATNITFQQLSNATRFTGTKNDLNAALSSAYFAPDPDTIGTVSFTIELNRLTGNLDWHTTTYGSITLTSTTPDRLEVYTTLPGPYDWEEDVSLVFNTGLSIIDDATTQLYLPAYGTDYTAIVRMHDPSGNILTHGSLTSEYKNLLTSYTENGAIFTMTGSRSAVNTCLQNIKFIPEIDWEGYEAEYVDADYVDADYVGTINSSMYVDFYVRRDYDNKVHLNYNQNYNVYFNEATVHEETSYTQTNISNNVLQEDTALSFSTGLQILDKATENADYSLYDTTYTLEARVKEILTYVDEDYVDTNYSQDITQAASNISIINNRTDLLDSYSGTGTVVDPFVMSATKSNMNIALTNMVFLPDEVDYELDATGFLVEYKLYRTQDSKTYYDYNIHTSIGKMLTHEEVTYSNPGYLVWDMNVSKVFDSGIEILDLATENEYFPNYYDTTYTVIVKSNVDVPYIDSGYVNDGYVEPQAREYNSRISSTQTHLLDSVSGTGRGEDYFVMTGSRSAINACLASMKMIPDVDWEAPYNFFWTYKVIRDADSLVYYDNNVSNTFVFNQSSSTIYSSQYATNYGNFSYAPFNFSTISKNWGSRNFSILDKVTQNSDYSDYYNTNYILKMRLKYWDDVNEEMVYIDDQNDGSIPFARIDINNKYPSNTQSGLGYYSDPFVITASKSQLDIILNGDYPQYSTKNNIRVLTNTFWNGSSAPEDLWPYLGYSGVTDDIWVFLEVYIEREQDGRVLSDWETFTLKGNLPSLDINDMVYSQSYYLNYTSGGTVGAQTTTGFNYNPLIEGDEIEYLRILDPNLTFVFEEEYSDDWYVGNTNHPYYLRMDGYMTGVDGLTQENASSSVNNVNNSWKQKLFVNWSGVSGAWYKVNLVSSLGHKLEIFKVTRGASTSSTWPNIILNNSLTRKYHSP